MLRLFFTESAPLTEILMFDYAGAWEFDIWQDWTFCLCWCLSMNAGFVMGEAGDTGESGEGGSSDL